MPTPMNNNPPVNNNAGAVPRIEPPHHSPTHGPAIRKYPAGSGNPMDHSPTCPAVQREAGTNNGG